MEGGGFGYRNSFITIFTASFEDLTSGQSLITSLLVIGFFAIIRTGYGRIVSIDSLAALSLSSIHCLTLINLESRDVNSAARSQPTNFQ